MIRITSEMIRITSAGGQVRGRDRAHLGGEPPYFRDEPARGPVENGPIISRLITLMLQFTTEMSRIISAVLRPRDRGLFASGNVVRLCAQGGLPIVSLA